jgi:hypothetical protein
MIDGTVIRSRYEAMRPRLDERGRRLFCAAEARSVGYGGVSVVARATGIARCTINRGLKDLKSLDPAPSKLRRPGGGRPALTQTRSYVTGRLARPAGADDAGRPYATAAVGVQEPCEARARARVAAWDIGFRRAGYRNCWDVWATAVRSTARVWRAVLNWTGTLNSNISTRRSKPFRPPVSP